MLLTALKTGRTSPGSAAFLHSEFTSVWEKGEEDSVEMKTAAAHPQLYLQVNAPELDVLDKIVKNSFRSAQV